MQNYLVMFTSKSSVGIRNHVKERLAGGASAASPRPASQLLPTRDEPRCRYYTPPSPSSPAAPRAPEAWFYSEKRRRKGEFFLKGKCGASGELSTD